MMVICHHYFAFMRIVINGSIQYEKVKKAACVPGSAMQCGMLLPAPLSTTPPDIPASASAAPVTGQPAETTWIWDMLQPNDWQMGMSLCLLMIAAVLIGRIYIQSATALWMLPRSGNKVMDITGISFASFYTWIGQVPRISLFL